MKTHTCAHTYYSPSLSLFQLEKSQSFCLQLQGFEVKRRNFQEERRGWMEKEEKKSKSEKKATHSYVCDILVTFYRNCFSTPSHTCKKKKKEILWECALRWMASKVVSGVFCTKGKRSFVARWYGFKNITAMGKGLFRFLSPGLRQGLTPSKLNRLCHL